MAKKTIHVLFICPRYPSIKDPVTGNFYHSQALGLKNKNISVNVMVPDYVSISKVLKGNKYKIVPKMNCYNLDGINVHIIEGIVFGFNSIINYYLRIFLSLFFFEFYRKKFGKPDIIHAHVSYLNGSIASTIKTFYKIPYLITEHSSGFFFGVYKKWQIREISKSYANASHRIVVSPSLKKTLLKIFGYEYIYMPNLVDTKFFKDQKENSSLLATKSSRFVFLTIAHLTLNKGINILIKAFAHKFKYLNAELWIGGSGDQLKELIKLAKRLGVEHKVIFLGQLNRLQVLSALIECNVFVLPSNYETFGVVLIEALSCGKPVISTECGGPEYIINENNGFLVPKQNHFYLAEAMIKVFDNYYAFDSKRIRKDCKKRFSEETIIKKLENLYNTILNK